MKCYFHFTDDKIEQFQKWIPFQIKQLIISKVQTDVEVSSILCQTNRNPKCMSICGNALRASKCSKVEGNKYYCPQFGDWALLKKVAALNFHESLQHSRKKKKHTLFSMFQHQEQKRQTQLKTLFSSLFLLSSLRVRWPSII